MPAKPVKMKEQYRLVMECRSSGLTDYQRCVEKGICPGTFYGWVRRLRQKGYQEIPESVHSQRASAKQEVVKIAPDIPALQDVHLPFLRLPIRHFRFQPWSFPWPVQCSASPTGQILPCCGRRST